MDTNCRELLLILEDENPVEKLMGDHGEMYNFLYYKENPEYAADVICRDKEKLTVYMKGLIKLYPMSSSLIERVFLKGLDISNSADWEKNLSEWFDVSRVMQRSFAKFMSICNISSIRKSEETLQADIDELNEKKEKLTEDMKRLDEMKQRNRKLRMEVDKLRQECDELKENYSEEKLKIDKANLINEMRKINEGKEKYINEIDELREEINKAKTEERPEFTEAMSALEQVMRYLSPDATETTD